MSAGGFVLIHRSLLGHAAFRNDAEAMAFAWMIARAAWKPTRVRYKERAITLDRGELAVSVRDLAEALDRPKGWVERLLIRLKTETMIETRSETGVNVITISNYSIYQAEQDSGETPHKTADETRAGQAPDTEQIREQINKNSSHVRPREAAPPSLFEQQCRTVAEIIRLTRPIGPADRDVMRAWLADGLHFDWHIVEGAKAVAARELGRGRSVNGFRYLDGGVRDYHADWVRDDNRLRAIAGGKS